MWPAMSLGGHRYSQLYLDLGSGFLWAIRMAKKTGHYQATPAVIADAQAASGRKLQYFQSDGDTVFSSKETGIFQDRACRHLWGAAGDSDTNPHTREQEERFLKELLLLFFALVRQVISGGRQRITKYLL